jgi:ferrochelatase
VVAVGVPDLDWTVCYQSRVGPLDWIGPSTDAEIRRAGADGVSVVVCPVAFVSEHSETLVELDIEYRHLAAQTGVPQYVRVPTVGCDPLFIEGLARLVREARARDPGVCSGAQRRLCPAAMDCAMAGAA